MHINFRNGVGVAAEDIVHVVLQGPVNAVNQLVSELHLIPPTVESSV
jgi:hypothetical protein